MTDLAVNQMQTITPPEPRVPINIRMATMDDYGFIDALQKTQKKALGFMYCQTLETYIKRGEVLIAATSSLPGGAAVSAVMAPSANANGNAQQTGGTPAPPKAGFQQTSGTPAPPHFHAPSSPLGYIISRDKYLKREELGVIYQLNVAPGTQRKLVGAALVKATFERAAYGCKLFCCWCAQDIAANYFWEAMGFLPLAFRTGSRGKRRTHIFWQRRINQEEQATRHQGIKGEGNMASRDQGDEGSMPFAPSSAPGCLDASMPNSRTPVPPTPYWFPSQTQGGAIREDRLVFPIPPGTHWSDAMPVLLPGVLPEDRTSEVRDQQRLTSDLCPLTSSSTPCPRKLRKKKEKADTRPRSVSARGGLRFGPPAPNASPAEKPQEKSRKNKARERRKNDPKFIAAARELRDRYLEAINLPENAHMLPEAKGKYVVSRQIAPGSFAPTQLRLAPLLEAA